MLGNPRIDPNSGISVSMRRIQDPAATVMVYTLPDRYVGLDQSSQTGLEQFTM